MSANLPITWLDKKNSPELEAFLAQFGEEYCLSAQEINQLRDGINSLVFRIATIENPDEVLKEIVPVVTDATVNVPADGFIWRLTQVEYTNALAYSQLLPASADGYIRTDIFVGTKSGIIVRVPGPEDIGVAIKPNAPVDTIELFSIDIEGANVADPIQPINNTDYVLKSEQYYTPVNLSGVHLKVGKKSASTGINFTGAVTTVGSLEVKPTYFNRLFDGVIYSIKNSQAIDIVFNHLSGTGNVLFSFPNGQPMTLKPNEIFQCKVRITSWNTAVLDYIGVSGTGGVELPITITDVTGLSDELAAKVTQAEIDSLGTQLLGGAPDDANTLKELNDKILAVQAIIGGTTADGDSLVNTVAELLAVFSTYSEGVDLVTLLAGKVNTTDVYNALDCIVAGKVADARQLKVLKDLHDTLVTAVGLKEDSSNKSQDIETDKASTSKFGSVKAFFDWCVGRFQPKLVPGANIAIDNTNPLAPVISASGGSGGDMTTTSDQTVSGIKTFLTGKLGLRNGANTFTSFLSNTNTASRTYTFQDRNGTLADLTDLAGKMANPTGGVANYLPKFLTGTTMGLSRLFDTGFFFGIGTTYSPTKDLTLGNQKNRDIGVEESDAATKGRDLTIAAGRTNDYIINSVFNALGTGYNIGSLTISSANDIYLLVAGNILKQTNSTGSFVSTTPSQSIGVIRIAPNGNLWGIRDGTGNTIFMQTGGVGDFNAMGGVNYLRALAVAPNGDVYVAGWFYGDIYKITGGVGSIVALGQTARQWEALAVAPNGDVYAITSSDSNYPAQNGDIYKQTGGVGNFVSTGQISRLWRGITVAPNGSVYATVDNGDVYVQFGGVGGFIPTGQISRNWSNIFSNTAGNLYATAGDLYFMDLSVKGTPNLDGGTLKHKAGTGKGTGKSRFEIWTGQKTASGTDMQVETLREYIDENGYHVYASMPVYADNASAITGGLPIGCEYRTATGVKMIVY